MVRGEEEKRERRVTEQPGSFDFGPSLPSRGRPRPMGAMGGGDMAVVYEERERTT
jgi:hypothetical protein